MTGYQALGVAVNTGGGTGSGAQPDFRRSPLEGNWPLRPSLPPPAVPMSPGHREALELGRPASRNPEDIRPEDPTPGAQPGAPFGTYALTEPLNDGAIHIRREELVNKAAMHVFASHFTFDDPGITQAYLEAVRRGVSVQLVLDAGQAVHASSNSENARIVEMIRGGVQIKTAAGADGRRMCHQKRLVIDSSICLVGSANMTVNSRDLAFEFGVCCTQSATVVACEAKIAQLWEGGVLMVPEEAEQRLARRNSKSRSRQRESTRR